MTIIPDKTATAKPAQAKKTGVILLNIILVISLAATILPPLHFVGGAFLLTSCGIHLALHGRWIKAVILEPPKNISPFLRRQRRLFWAKLISGIICGLSGLVTLLSTLELHFLLPVHCLGTPIHALSGLTFLGLNIYHLVTHQSWFGKNLASFPKTSK